MKTKRIYLLGLLFLVVAGPVAYADERSISISLQNDQYSVTFYDFRPETMAWFEQRQLQGGGYTWEALIRASLDISPPEPGYSIEFDSEGDQFFAYVDSGPAAAELKQRIERLTEDAAYRKVCMDAASQGGYLE